MYLLLDESLDANVYTIPFPQLSQDEAKNKIDMNLYANNLRTMKDKLKNETIESFKKHKYAYIHFIISTGIKWVALGSLFSYSIPAFSLYILENTYVTHLIIKTMDESYGDDVRKETKKFLKDNLKNLKQIRQNNRHNELIVDKVDAVIAYNKKLLKTL